MNMKAIMSIITISAAASLLNAPISRAQETAPEPADLAQAQEAMQAAQDELARAQAEAQNAQAQAQKAQADAKADFAKAQQQQQQMERVQKEMAQASARLAPEFGGMPPHRGRNTRSGCRIYWCAARIPAPAKRWSFALRNPT